LILGIKFIRSDGYRCCKQKTEITYLGDQDAQNSL